MDCDNEESTSAFLSLKSHIYLYIKFISIALLNFYRPYQLSGVSHALTNCHYPEPCVDAYLIAYESIPVKVLCNPCNIIFPNGYIIFHLVSAAAKSVAELEKKKEE